jgi:hypothetical protein
MLRHVVLFRWSESTSDADVAAIADGLATLPGEIPEISTYRFGRDVGINEGAHDFVVVADFQSVDDYLVYRDHPTHKAVLAERIAPHVADRAFIQYEY